MATDSPPKKRVNRVLFPNRGSIQATGNSLAEKVPEVWHYSEAPVEGGPDMENKPRKVRIHWFWGFVGCSGVLGFLLAEPFYHAFFVFFLFFLEPVVKKIKR